MLRSDETQMLRLGAGNEAWKFLKRRLKEFGLSDEGGALRTKGNCLRVCEKEHLIRGRIVADYLIIAHPLE